ncbi:MAG: HEAT repeat domain-containing protein [Chloroflexota bacterium]
MNLLFRVLAFIAAISLVIIAGIVLFFGILDSGELKAIPALVLAASVGLAVALGKYALSKPQIDTSIPVPRNASPAVKQAIKALDSNDPDERKNAIENLGKMSDPAGREALVNATNHPHNDVRFGSGFKLAELHDDRSVPAIIEALYGEDWSIAAQAVNALKPLGSRVVPSFIKALDHENPEIRFQAARTLGQVGFNLTNKAVPHLIRTLNDNYPKIRSAAAESLASIGDVQAVPELVDAFNKEKDDNVLESIIVGLGILGDGAIVSLLANRLLKPNTTAVVTKIVTALQRIHTVEALVVANRYNGSHYWEEGISANRQWQSANQNQP